MYDDFEGVPYIDGSDNDCFDNNAYFNKHLKLENGEVKSRTTTSLTAPALEVREGMSAREIALTKPKLSLVPLAALEAITEALDYGNKKHGGAFNWRTFPLNRMECYSKVLRHITDSIEGNEVAEDSQISNLSHAIANLAIMLDALKYNQLIDDRPKRIKK